MAAGDYTLTNHGVHSISGSTLKTTIDAINITRDQLASGAQLIIAPAGNGQVGVLEINHEA